MRAWMLADYSVVSAFAFVRQIILSDLVVWWRVWVLWRDSRVMYRWLVYICGGILLSTTFGEPPALPY